MIIWIACFEILAICFEKIWPHYLVIISDSYTFPSRGKRKENKGPEIEIVTATQLFDNASSSQGGQL